MMKLFYILVVTNRRFDFRPKSVRNKCTQFRQKNRFSLF